jgi:hypothetical protein
VTARDGRDRHWPSAAVGIALAVFLIHAATSGQDGPGPARADAAAAPAAVPGRVAARVPGPGEAAFFSAVLADLGAPRTRRDLGSLAAWAVHEFPAWPPAADWNPLASTHQVPGATAFNTFSGGGRVLHVWNYPSATAGAAATAATLANGHYPHLLAALRSGRGLCGGRYAPDFTTWNGGGYAAVC